MLSIEKEKPVDQNNILKFASKDGEYRRLVSSFRNHIAPDGKFQPEKGRYRLYVSYACPWASRALMMRALKGLEDVIDICVVDPLMSEKGWSFSDPETSPGSDVEPQYNAKYLRELYFKADPNYNGRFTVPMLWDSKTETIVNNESSEIIRMLNTEFNAFAKNPDGCYYPPELRSEIDAMNKLVYESVNNGVYKTGFATKQSVYEAHCRKLFETLDRIESEYLSNGREFLVGKGKGVFTEADIRLFVTMVRFDPVYTGHFKCNLKCVKYDYPNILKWMRKIYAMPGIKATVNMEHIKNHYYMSHTGINPNRIVGLSDGPALE